LIQFQTFGQLIHWHPHIHALVTEGVFVPDGTFLPLPRLATEPFLRQWEQEVFALLLAEGKITEDVVANMRSWKHSGFSVDQSVQLEAGDQQGVQRLLEYFLRCPFSQARMIQVTEAGQVIYKTDHNAVGRFPEPGDEELLAGPARNFQVFDPLDFLAEVTQHIPAPGEHLIRYYGWYSNKTRGQRGQTPPAGGGVNGPFAHGSRGAQRLGGLDPPGLRSGSPVLPQVWFRDEDHRLHRAAPDQGDREDSAALRAAGREPGPRAAGDGGAGRGLNRRSRRKRGDCAQRCGERPDFRPVSP